MVTITFVDEVTIVEPGWCNDVDAAVYQGVFNTALTLGEEASATDPGAGKGKFWVKSDAPTRPYFTDDTDLDRKIMTLSPVVAGHTRAGNTQIWSGDTAVTGILDVVADLTENTWETVGPTGSGADNIWLDMDRLPSNATILIVDCESFGSTGDTTTLTWFVYVVQGDEASPVASHTNNRVVFYSIDHDADITGNDSVVSRLFIPLGATNQTFHLNWKVTGTSDNEEIEFFYRGFMTDG